MVSALCEGSGRSLLRVAALVWVSLSDCLPPGSPRPIHSIADPRYKSHSHSVLKTFPWFPAAFQPPREASRAGSSVRAGMW